MWAEAWWNWRWQRSAALSVAWGLILLLRPLARHLGGEVLLHALWALLPMVVLSTLAAQMWPGWAPASALTGKADVFSGAIAEPVALAAPATTELDWRLLLLWVWLVGVIAVIALAAMRQSQLTRSLRTAGDHWTSALESGPALVGLGRRAWCCRSISGRASIEGEVLAEVEIGVDGKATAARQHRADPDQLPDGSSAVVRRSFATAGWRPSERRTRPVRSMKMYSTMPGNAARVVIR